MGMSVGIEMGQALATFARKSALAQTKTDVATLNAAVANMPLAAQLGVKDVPVVILMGQSNTDGRANLSDFAGLSASTENTSFAGKVKIFSKSVTRSPANAAVNRVDNGTWADYTVGNMVVSPTGTAASAFGPEYPLAAWWRDTQHGSVGKPLYIIKLAVGGTSLTPSGTAADSNWSDSDGQLRELAREFVVSPALRLLRLQGLTPRLMGIFWGQGESDADSAAQATAYQAALTGLIAEMQAKYGFDNPRIVVMGLSAYNTPAVNWATVKAAQVSAVNALKASGKDVTLMSTDGSDGVTPASRYLSGVAAGNIHYDSLGQMQIGKRLTQLFSASPSTYKKQWDFEFFGAAYPVGEPLILNSANGFAGVNDTWATLKVVPFPTTTGYVNAVTWVRDGEKAFRDYGTPPMPSFQLSALTGATDVEIIFRMIHDGDGVTKPGFGIRGAYHQTTSDFNSQGYLTQVRGGGSQLTMFRREANNNWTAMPGSHLTPTQYPAASNPYWYRIVIKGTTWTVWNSPDGRTWTQQWTGTDATYTSGNVQFSLYNGEMTKAIGNQLAAHCAFDVILARKLN